jgi:4-phosphopantoate--beta-alanine ligase
MREKLVEGVEAGITAMQGLIAHGRGEAFDYILGEKTHPFAERAEEVAVALMLLAKHPVISVNGNAAVLSGQDIAELAKEVNAEVEVNIFHFSRNRVERIRDHLKQFGVDVLAACDAELRGLASARRIVDSRGIYIADVVLVPLEDGDRCEILKKHGKKVIAIDLNPLSRTAKMADVTIVDNITRAIPNMVRIARKFKQRSVTELKKVVNEYNNKEALRDAIVAIRENLTSIAETLRLK